LILGVDGGGEAMLEIAVTDLLPGGVLERLPVGITARVASLGRALGGLELAEFVGTAPALLCHVVDRVDRDFFAAASSVRVVANFGVGVNNIDLAAAQKAGVWVTNTPDVLTEATADLAWALILALTRRVAEGDRLIRSQASWQWRPGFFLGAGLQGKTLGIVGFGRIGRAVARRAGAFGVRVLYHDPAFGAAGEPDGFPVADLDELLPAVDVLSLHCPLVAATHHLLNARRLRLLRPGAFVVNTSRGEVIDENALVEALVEGRLGGAGLDVYEHEPQVHPGLLNRDDVVLLPHLGSATRETRTAMARLALANAVAVLQGRVPPNPVVTPSKPLAR
jgi:glyoxylate reductase